jgi:hypothetical protein
MARGGKREGAGRKAGAATRKTREAADFIASLGLTPLGYMQGVLEGTLAYDEHKAWAAEKAAPYVHARLAAVEHSGPGGGPLQVQEVEWTIVDPQAQTPDRPRLRAIAGGK